MSYYSGRIIEIQLDSYKKYIFRVEINAPVFWQPGHYFNAYLPQDSDHHIPLTLFPVNFIPLNDSSKIIDLLPYEDIQWRPGNEIKIRGPLGRNWKLSAPSQRLMFLNLTEHFGFLKPLIEHYRQLGKVISLLTKNNSGGLAEEIEVLPISEFPEMLSWADQIILDIERVDFHLLEKLTGMPTYMIPGHTAVMILDHFPCGGKADCGICAISPKNKTLYPCKDGPLFNLKDLIRK